MRTALVLAALAALVHPVRAGGVSSAYTDLDWKKDCATYAPAGDNDGDWADLACAGYRGYPVLIAYGDERESLFYGFPANDMTTVWESFAAFNASAGRVEWRIETDGDLAFPFAAIHRRSVSDAGDPDRKIEVLMVSKVAQPEAREGCTVGLVLASGNPQANDQARRIADDKARAFKCGKDERTTVGAVPAFGRVDN